MAIVARSRAFSFLSESSSPSTSAHSHSLATVLATIRWWFHSNAPTAASAISPTATTISTPCAPTIFTKLPQTPTTRPSFKTSPAPTPKKNSKKIPQKNLRIESFKIRPHACKPWSRSSRKKKWRWRGESRFAKLPLCLLSSSPPAAKSRREEKAKGKKRRCLFFIPKVSPSFSFPWLELKEIAFLAFLSHIFETSL